MPAPTGNTNALKWTLEKTEKLISNVEALAEEENVLYLGQAMALEKTSTKQWNRLREYYADNEDLMERMDAIEQKFEARLAIGSLTGRFKTNAAQFILKNRHGFTSYKKELEATQSPLAKAPSAPQLPPPDLIYVQESDDGDSFCMSSSYGTGLEYVIYAEDGDEVQSGPVTGDRQKVIISSLPDGDYEVLIRGPQNSNVRDFSIDREE